MVELTLSAVGPGPGKKFAPAPKIRPRPGGRVRPAAAPSPAPSASSQATSASTTAHTASQQSAPVPVLNPIPASSSETSTPNNVQPPATASTTQSSGEVLAPAIEVISSGTNVTPDIPQIIQPDHSSSVPAEIPLREVNNTINIERSTARTSEPPSIISASTSRSTPVPPPISQASSHNVLDYEEEGFVARPVSRPIAPPRIVSASAVSQRPQQEMPPFSSGNLDDDEEGRVPLSKPPSRMTAPPKILSSSQRTSTPIDENQVADVGNPTHAEIDCSISEPRRKKRKTRDSNDTETASNAESARADEEEMELTEETIPTTSLADLIKNKFSRGKLSKVEELRQQQREEQKRRRRFREGSVSSIRTARTRESTPSTEREASPALSEIDREGTPQVSQTGPRLIMVDGKLVVDKESLVMRTQQAADEDLEQVDEGSHRHITSASFWTKKRVGRVRWSADNTERFYEGLSYFGPNFMMISNMFPQYTRDQVKKKFEAEEKKNGDRITQAIRNRRPAPRELIEQMKECAQQRVAKRTKKDSEDEADVYAPPAKRRMSATPVPGAPESTNNAVGTQPGASGVKPNAGDAAPVGQEEDSEDIPPPARPPPRAMPDEEQAGAPERVHVAPLLSRPPVIGHAGIKPKMAPKVIPRRRRTKESQVENSAQDQQVQASQEETDARELVPTAAPAPAVPEPQPGYVSRHRAIPTIGTARRGNAISTPAIRAQPPARAGYAEIEQDATEALVQGEENVGNDDFETTGDAD